MTTKIENYGLRWTDANGVSRAAAVSYDKTSAEDYKTRLEADGCTDVEIKATKVGELLQPKV
ncbi:hypothetical protein [Streptomyces sp. KN37]|uniref:hypothetical protein n=1 Tax=Streptomyces sp. KN37 TaxID=3090667 RepID=UPI002A763C6A|nr:hypothetical protein [Streptomyces sp. KN37]WPO70181.1 hypothetical protein R9806_05845 [Streptomyces sp. KN37]WPO74048.1 hypothetical protein R9806_27215 [Streptomyces sp. KN37]